MTAFGDRPSALRTSRMRTYDSSEKYPARSCSTGSAKAAASRRLRRRGIESENRRMREESRESGLGAGHRFGIEQTVQLFAREQAAVAHEFVDAASTLECLLGNRRGGFISEGGNQRGHDSNRVLHELSRTRRIGRDAIDAALAEH